MAHDEYDLADESPAQAVRSAAPPQQKPKIVTVQSGGFVRGNLVVVRDGAQLPDRCIKCNASAAEGRVTKRLGWDEPQNGLAAGGLMPYIGVFFKIAWLVKKISQGRYYTTVSYCVCKKHRTQRMIMLGLMVLGIIAGVGLIDLAVQQKNPALIGAAAAAFIAAAICGMSTGGLAIASPAQGGAELKGAGRAFLESMPKAGQRLKFR
ncbi:MAG TPA: hypothetical protein VL282_03930 [Tepidisphaeraceae bacterium]|jgi:hypothetical protein|nr:hypothetical protein [Tepidisphaeraceae bacterium]